MAPVRAFELRSKKKTELVKQLDELKQELASLNVQKVAGGSSSKVAKINGVRKSIARVLTVISHQTRDNLRLFYGKKKLLPLDLRTKQTRAIRRKLSEKDANRKTVREQKKAKHFPQRKYAVKA